MLPYHSPSFPPASPMLSATAYRLASFDNLPCPSFTIVERFHCNISCTNRTDIMMTNHISLRDDTPQAGPSRFAVPAQNPSATLQDLVRLIRRSKRIVVVCGELAGFLNVESSCQVLGCPLLLVFPTSEDLPDCSQICTKARHL